MKTRTNIFISFSFKQSNNIKTELEEKLAYSDYAVNYSEKIDRSQNSPETIWKYLKNKIAGSSVMLVIYSMDLVKGHGGKGCKIRDKYQNRSDINDFRKEGWVYKEIKCALRDGKNNSINGILVIVPDKMKEKVWSEDYCNDCKHNIIKINKEFMPEVILKNHYNIKEKTLSCGCCYDYLYDSYIPIIKLSEFYKNPQKYIELVKTKRNKIELFDIKKKF